MTGAGEREIWGRLGDRPSGGLSPRDQDFVGEWGGVEGKVKEQRFRSGGGPQPQV